MHNWDLYISRDAYRHCADVKVHTLVHQQSRRYIKLPVTWERPITSGETPERDGEREWSVIWCNTGHCGILKVIEGQCVCVWRHVCTSMMTDSTVQHRLHYKDVWTLLHMQSCMLTTIWTHFLPVVHLLVWHGVCKTWCTKECISLALLEKARSSHTVALHLSIMPVLYSL